MVKKYISTVVSVTLYLEKDMTFTGMWVSERWQLVNYWKW